MDGKPTYEDLEQRVKELEREAFERTKTEEALRENEKKYRGIYENILDVYYEVTLDGIILEVSPSIEEVSPYKREEIIGKSLYGIYIDPGKRDKFVKELLKNGKVTDYEILLKDKDGSQGYCSITAKLVSDQHGNPAKIIGSMRNINRRKQLEEALRESVERYRTLVESTSDAVLMLDAERRVISCNRAFLDLFGYGREEVEGKSVRIIHQSDESFHALGERLYPTIEKAGTCRTEWELMRKDGDTFPVETVTSALESPDGSTTGYVAIIRDVTERKLTEKALQKRTDVLVKRVKELNCLYGISDLVEKPGVSLDEILQGVVDLIPLSWQYPEITCSRIILKEKEVKTKNFRESVWKQAQDITVHGEINGTLEVCYFEEMPEHDEGPFLTEERLLIKAVAERLGKIIERRRAEEALQEAHNELERRVEERTIELMNANEKLNQEIEIRRQAEEELKESTKRIKLFAYSVSHDLKSPTISIYGLTKRLSKHYRNIFDEKGKTFCDQILKASEQIARLTENINVYISTKEAPITIENVNLRELFQMVREEIAPQLSIRKVRWSQPAYLPEIKADRLAIMRIIRNLVDNALKYGGDDLSEISIGYQESDESHILSVMDDGIGLKARDSREIFDTFKRTETSRGIEGAGLGLAIVKEIAERHAGKIWMKRGTEKGANFRVSISKNLQLSH